MYSSVNFHCLKYLEKNSTNKCSIHHGGTLTYFHASLDLCVKTSENAYCLCSLFRIKVCSSKTMRVGPVFGYSELMPEVLVSNPYKSRFKS